MRVNLQPGYVLHRRAYRDTSTILELFTLEHGRLSAVARGARRQSRRGTAGRLSSQLFQPLLLSFSGRGELKTLTASEAAGSAHELRADQREEEEVGRRVGHDEQVVHGHQGHHPLRRTELEPDLQRKEKNKMKTKAAESFLFHIFGLERFSLQKKWALKFNSCGRVRFYSVLLSFSLSMAL